MFSTEEKLRIFKAFEMTAKGKSFLEVDLNKPFADAFKFKVEEKLTKFMALPFNGVSRDGAKFYGCIPEGDMPELTEPVLVKIMSILYKAGVDTYEGISKQYYDEEERARIQKIKDTHNYKAVLDCAIKNELTIANTDKEFKALLASVRYPAEVMHKIYKAYKTSLKKTVLVDFQDFEITDNRIIIPLSEYDKECILEQYALEVEEAPEEVKNIKAFVISKNPLDYFYASYGNTFQSCFALNSTHNYLYGYLPTCVAPQSFICYATTGEVRKTSLIGGTKFSLPQMVWRSWGYADEEGHLLIDKKYRSRGVDPCIHFMCKWLAETFGCICDSKEQRQSRKLWKNGAALYTALKASGYKTYLDSLNLRERHATFWYNAGDCSTGREGPDMTHMVSFLSNFSDYKDLDLDANINFSGRILCNSYTCPVTGLSVSERGEKHYLSKYFSRPVQKTVLLTYVDGKGYVTDYTTGLRAIDTELVGINIPHGGYCTTANKLWGDEKQYPLKVWKEAFKGCLKSDVDCDAIILRAIEEDKLTINVYLNKEKMKCETC